mgnify:CR=1 FL=1
MSKNTDKIEVTAAEFRDLAARLADEKTAGESKATNERERLRIERERLALEREKIRAEYERERLRNEQARRTQQQTTDPDTETGKRFLFTAAGVVSFVVFLAAGLAIAL